VQTRVLCLKKKAARSIWSPESANIQVIRPPDSLVGC